MVGGGGASASGSMEPAFHRGDLLFLYRPDSPIEVGEIVVFKLDGRDIPIVHRVLKVHQRYCRRGKEGVVPLEETQSKSHHTMGGRRPDGEVDMLTKGDNNAVDDRGLYPAGQLWLNERHIIGRARGYGALVRRDSFWLARCGS